MDYSILIGLGVTGYVIETIFSHKAQQRMCQLAESTHQIVNSQRSAMQRAAYLLLKRIAEENPDDAEAQEALRVAKAELETLDKPRR